VSAARLHAVDRGIPRRLSVRKSDRFHDPEIVARLDDKVAVLLDGRELPEVTSWDVDAGEITRRVRRDDGSFIFDTDGVPALEVMSGSVEVRWKESVE
jgi:hypothetical protein